MIAAIAPVAELVDAPDSESGDGNIVLVRSRPGAPAFAATRLRLGNRSASIAHTSRHEGTPASLPFVGGGIESALRSCLERSSAGSLLSGNANGLPQFV
jgi:hypothetical protein